MQRNHLSERRTETVIEDLLDIQGWDVSRPPKGRVIRQNEYKNHPHLADIFRGKSKTGSGDAYPDFLIVSRDGLIPLMVIEAKADAKDIIQAVEEARHYAEACMQTGHKVIAVGFAGQSDSEFKIAVEKHFVSEWTAISYGGSPITWMPRPTEIEGLLASEQMLDLAPVVPRPEVLAKKADFINKTLREAHVKDEFRPMYVGAVMLALWRTRGQIRRDAQFVVHDINAACEDAFTNAGKQELAKSLHLDESNQHLAASLWQIINELEKLNVVTAAFDHDYLGQLYETFFRYTGGNTIGQYFTPRHVARMMADICEVTETDKVIDPACGTGGFLIAAMQRVFETNKMSYEETVKIVRENLFGYESEPVTAALCVVNMILRGDGKSGIRKDNCFTAKDYPNGNCDVALMNPPFPHKATDAPPQIFIDRALESLKPRGKLAVIVPTSFLVKRDGEILTWRERLMRENSLVAVCQLPDELFQPFASTTTSVLVIEKGVPQSASRKTVFVRVEYDGLTLKKGARVERADKLNQLQAATDAILNKTVAAGFSGVANISSPSDEWATGAYIPSAIRPSEEIKVNVDELLRRSASFYIRYAKEIANLRKKVSSGELVPRSYEEMLGESRLRNAERMSRGGNTVGAHFNIFYGQKSLHSRDGIPNGDTLIISPTEQYNGCYGWLDFSDVIKPSFVTVAQTGSIGEAFVQEEVCGVNDDCLILLPKAGSTSLGKLFVAAAVIRLEKWRFNYGRKLTPQRICDFVMPDDEELYAWAEEKITMWKKVTESAVANYIDE